MSEGKHTPGNWSVDEMGAENFYRTNHWFYVQGPVMRVACVEGMGTEPQANAHLISAAPDLKEALEEVMVWIKNWDGGFLEDPEWPEAQAKLEAALSKSNGEK